VRTVGPQLRVLTPGRYPDASVVCGAAGNDSAIIAVFEVLSPSTALTDRDVKAMEYASVPGILVYMMLETERPEVTVRRRAT